METLSAPQKAPLSIQRAPLSIAREDLNLSINGRLFTLAAMPEEDEKGNRPAHKWMTDRFIFHWRQLVCFRGIKGTVVSALPARENKKSDNARDERLYELTGEWVTLGNMLVAQALKLNDPAESEFVKSLDFKQKMKIIVAQDNLNGLDLVNELAKIEDARRAGEKIQAEIEKAAEEKVKAQEKAQEKERELMARSIKATKKMKKKQIEKRARKKNRDK